LKKCTAANERFGVMAAEARRNGSAYLEVYRPPEPLWNPRLREAATTLAARQGDARADNETRK